MLLSGTTAYARKKCSNLHFQVLNMENMENAEHYEPGEHFGFFLKIWVFSMLQETQHQVRMALMSC